MKLYELRSGERNITATNDTWTTDVIKGEVKKIEYIVSGTATVKAYSLHGTDADEYLTGGASASLSVSPGKANCYPVTHNTAIADNAAYAEGTDKTASRTPVIVNGQIEVVSTLTSTTTGTWEAIIKYARG